jgi:hypothetical protein
MTELLLKTLKPRVVEEAVDVYFYRRAALPLVLAFRRLRLTPNGVTTLSLIAGLSGSYLVLKGQFLLGALVCVLAIVLDCSDGQLARLTGNTSPLGRILDGFYDAVWVTALWLAVYFSDYFHESGLARPVLALMILSSLSTYLHCWKFDGVKIRYLELTLPGYHEKDLDFNDAKEGLKKEFRQHHFYTAFLYLLIAFEVYFFVRGTKKKKQQFRPESIDTATKNEMDRAIRGWTWLGEGIHNTLIVAGLIIAPWTSFGLLSAFTIILIPMNLWFAYSLMRWNSCLTKVSALRGLSRSD